MNEVTPAQSALLSTARAHLAARRLDAARHDFETALTLGPVDAAAYNDYGRVLNNLREYDAARQAFASAIALAPDFAEAHNNLGHVLRALNQAEDSAASFRRALALQPDYQRAWQNLGTVLALTGDYEEAITALEKSLALAPGDADAHLNLAGLYRVTDRPEKAERHIQHAVELSPDLVDAWVQLASLQESRGQLDQSMESYATALKLNPLHTEALAGMADVMDKCGQYQQGLALLAPALERLPDDPKLLVAHARLLRRTGHSDEALRLLSGAEGERHDQFARLPRYFYTLGELYDETGEYDKAFENYARANKLKNEKFNPADITEAVDALIAVFSKAFVASATASSSRSERPVFIVGMPRSGTSLVEQILASHPDVYGAGELRLIVDMVRAMGADASVAGYYPECIAAFTQGRLNELADAYLDALNEMDSNARRVTDKMPHNFLHLGFLHMLFPHARVIHCMRHPLDTILSCYFQDFASSAMAFSNDLDHLATYYQQYHRLMQHWRKVLPGGFLDVRYEALVDDPRAEAARMLEYLGLDWDDAVLAFHKSKRLVKTASHAQVRQPVYRRSLARHVHYARHLAAVRSTLGLQLAD